jgi:hypothetical protein
MDFESIENAKFFRRWGHKFDKSAQVVVLSCPTLQVWRDFHQLIYMPVVGKNKQAIYSKEKGEKKIEPTSDLTRGKSLGPWTANEYATELHCGVKLS